MPTTVVGIGQPFAGDDAAGPSVVRALRAGGLPGGVQALEVPEPSDLVPVLERGGEVIVVDAVVGGPVGSVIDLDPDEADPAEPLAVSSHGIGLLQAIALARALAQGRPIAHTRIIGIGIERPRLRMKQLSPEVAAAVPRAVRAIRRMLAKQPR